MDKIKIIHLEAAERLLREAALEIEQAELRSPENAISKEQLERLMYEKNALEKALFEKRKKIIGEIAEMCLLLNKGNSVYLKWSETGHVSIISVDCFELHTVMRGMTYCGPASWKEDLSTFTRTLFDNSTDLKKFFDITKEIVSKFLENHPSNIKKMEAKNIALAAVFRSLDMDQVVNEIF